MPIAGFPIGNTVVATGAVTAPGALGLITSIAAASLPAGTYQVVAKVWYGATAGAENDMIINAGGTQIGQFIIDAVATNNNPVTIEFIRNLDGATNLNIQAVGGAAGVYKAYIEATKIRGG